MTTILDVVNECLGTMGEAPLNTLTEPHEFKASSQRVLAAANARIQARGWWFNTEAATFDPAPITETIQLPGDCLKWQSGQLSSDLQLRSQAKPWLVERGGRLYDTRARTFAITESVTGELTREIPFEQLPRVIAEYVKAETILKFQSSYDADNSKRQELMQAWQICRGEANAENIRQLGVNMINMNPRLQRIKNVARRSA